MCTHVSLSRIIRCSISPFNNFSNYDLSVAHLQHLYQSHITAKPWFSQQQAENTYSPKSRNYCVRAEYNVRRRKTLWGYTVDVSNTAQDVTGEEFGGDLCAYQAGEPGKLAGKLINLRLLLFLLLIGPIYKKRLHQKRLHSYYSAHCSFLSHHRNIVTNCIYLIIHV